MVCYLRPNWIPMSLFKVTLFEHISSWSIPHLQQLNYIYLVPTIYQESYQEQELKKLIRPSRSKAVPVQKVRHRNK